MFTNPTASISSSLDCTLSYHQTLKSSSILYLSISVWLNPTSNTVDFFKRICTTASIHPELFKSKVSSSTTGFVHIFEQCCTTNKLEKDLSGNSIHDALAYQLPPNLTSLNLANNNLIGNLPYSIAMMFNLNYMNFGRNVLTQTTGDIFNNLTSLSTLDVSNNNLTGDLPNSVISLSSISTFHVQNNQLTGSLNTLVGLPLTDVN